MPPGHARLASAALSASLIVTSSIGSSAPLEWVDPRIGTAGDGATFPGPVVPFGMIRWSPDTGKEAGGYRYGASHIQGFSLTRLSGIGCAHGQDVPIIFTTRDLTTSPVTSETAYQETFSAADENVMVGRYAVKLGSGVVVELASANRAAVGRALFPEGAARRVLFAPGRNGTKVTGATLSIDAKNRRVTGSVDSGYFCGKGNTYKLYFAIEFEDPITAHGVWVEGAPQAGVSTSTEKTAAGYVEVGGEDRSVSLRVAISYVSEAGALTNLKAEMPDYDVTRARDAAQEAWDALLSRFSVEGGTNDRKRAFYTALYHALLDPSTFSDWDGQYVGYDKLVHQLPEGEVQYANFSLWDTYRTQGQLLGLIAPEQASDIAASLVRNAKECGGAPLWGYANDESGVMIGYPAAPFIANLRAFGGEDFDLSAATQRLFAAARSPLTCNGRAAYWGVSSWVKAGYLVTGSTYAATSAALEYATADFALARLAEAQGDEKSRAEFDERATQWKNMLDPDTRFFRPRVSGGEFREAFDPASSGPKDRPDFIEGNAYQYAFMVPHDVPGLVTALGGKAAAAERLDAFFSKIHYAGWHSDATTFWAGNEPSLTFPWVYGELGLRCRTEAVLKQVLNEGYAATPAGLPGNDDTGTLSSWYVFAALGLYPYVPGVAELAVTAPYFSKAVLTLPNARTLTINSPAGKVYTQSIRANGQLVTGSSVKLAQLFASTGQAELNVETSDAPPATCKLPTEGPGGAGAGGAAGASNGGAGGSSTASGGTPSAAGQDDNLGGGAGTPATGGSVSGGGSEDPGGCGCRVEASAGRTPATGVALLVLLGALLRRKRGLSAARGVRGTHAASRPSSA
jgi:predicted alpha-1,2-mannosidase